MVRTRFGETHDYTEEDLFHHTRTRSVKRNSQSEAEDVVSTIQDGHLYYSPRNKSKKTFAFSSASPVSSTKGSPMYSSKRRGRPRRFPEDDTPPRVSGHYTRRKNMSPELSKRSPTIGGRGMAGQTPRRSSRQRKPVYNTLDQSLIVTSKRQQAAQKHDKDDEERDDEERDDEDEDDEHEDDEHEDDEHEDDEHEDDERNEDYKEDEDSGENKDVLDDEEEEEDDYKGNVASGGIGDIQEQDEEEEDPDYKEGDESEEEQVKKNEDVEMERLDMYSRVKQRHIQARKSREERARILMEEEKRRRKEEANGLEEESEAESSESDTDEECSDDDCGVQVRGRNYHLRKDRAPTKRYEVPVEVKIPRQRKAYFLDEFGNPNSPIQRHYPLNKNHLTPTRSPRFKRHKQHATHHSSSTSSDDSGDERKFERRKSKSMAKARLRCLPMNFVPDEAASGVLRDRQNIGSSLADVDPMNIDTSVTFESVGGLRKHIQSLKEMVVFPLLYPEVFANFKITPPRGVLFHGPPGTGKTLVARALANECRQGDKRVAFFMRKGADCLSKWVGESERQLRLLFDQAYIMRPSIIFFDEIDGLAPVRSSRQDQIHSSIVSTLLALMDGLDSRGEIVVIGATNRIDSIDPALRRPGRFDREFLFSLPTCEARQSILTIHTKEWNPKLSDSFLSEVAERCVGYCGADLKALCTETALFALRHQFPQIYSSKEKLQLDLSQIQISARDFHLAMQNIVPAAQRSVVSPGRSLSHTAQPLLQRQLVFVLEKLKSIFPAACSKKNSKKEHGECDTQDVLGELLDGDAYDDEDGPSIFVTPPAKRRKIDQDNNVKAFLNFSSSSFSTPITFRPRFLLAGDSEQAHGFHVAPAVLHHVEELPVHCLDLPSLYAVSAKNPEESCAQVFREARRTSPSIIYMPHIVQWWQACNYTLQATFLTLLDDLPPTVPILLLATADCSLQHIPSEIKDLFSSLREVYTMRNPTVDERREFFSEVILVQAAKAPPRRKQFAAKALEVLPLAVPPEPRSLTNNEEEKLQAKEEATHRELRIFLRDVLSRLALEKKFRNFTKAVDPEEVPDYFKVIKEPMDLSTMVNKINMYQYISAKEFLGDIDLITRNALEYNPDRDPSDRQIRSRACELKDMAYAIIDAEMDTDFEQLCMDIEKSRLARGTVRPMCVPSFYRTLPQLEQETALNAAKINLSPVQHPRLANTSPRLTHGSKPRYKKRRPTMWSRGFLPKKPKKRVESESESNEDKEKVDESQEVEENRCQENEGSDQEKNTEERTIDAKEVESEQCDESNGNICEEHISNVTTEEERQDKEEETNLANGIIRGSSEDDDTESIASEPVNKRPSLDTTDHPVDSETSKVLINGIAQTDDDSKVIVNVRDKIKIEDSSPVTESQTETTEGQESQDAAGDKDGTADTTNVGTKLRRVTRGMLANINASRALEILDEPVPEFIVDKPRLQTLLHTMVEITTNWTVARLEKLHCRLSQCVYKHREDYNRTELIVEMETQVSQSRLDPMQT